MSGFFSGYIRTGLANPDFYSKTFSMMISRGKNSSSLIQETAEGQYSLLKSQRPLSEFSNRLSATSRFTIGFCGINASSQPQISPLVSDDFILYHDGLLLNRPVNTNVFSVSTPSNSDLLLEWMKFELKEGASVTEAVTTAMSKAQGTVNGLLFVRKHRKLVVFSNHGSLFVLNDENKLLIASERRWLQEYAAQAIQVRGVNEFELDKLAPEFHLEEKHLFNETPALIPLTSEINVLQYKKHELKRCSRCILPETMPYIRFDAEGVCNYCHSYKKRNQPKNKEALFELVEPYRRARGYDCVVPFSGGRDSCYTLHMVVKELKLKPVTYTYDWGMVTDVGRRNIALMCGALGVENIVVADDIEKKRRNIAMNFSAWLKNPHLGMLNILTAGDKHFFRYINKIKEDTGLRLNLWGVNPLEVTHFKTGFLGIEPDFERQKVYASGKMGQLRYQGKRLKQMLKSPGYFNSSLWDTWSGEYYRSAAKKTDYFHIFDFIQWNEEEVNGLLLNEYNWELASDTPTTWRIGDGTAGIYNYIYYTLAGFTEHDTFRSNQVREGELTREDALKLIELENAPCHDNLRWYLQSIGFDFVETIRRINSIPRLHENLY